jgi:hypothetical protein
MMFSQKESYGRRKMENTGYAHFAEALIFAHGPAAACEAARHALLCEKSGDTETAETWRSLQAHVGQLQPQFSC